MMAVGAVGNRGLRGFPSSLWSRTLRPWGASASTAPVGRHWRRRALLEHGAAGLFALPGQEESSRERPRDGCDGGTPIAPENRRFSGGRSRHYARRYIGLGCLPGSVIGPARTALSEAIGAVAAV